MKSFILSAHLIISLVALLAVYVNNAKETQLEPNEFQVNFLLYRLFNAFKNRICQENLFANSMLTIRMNIIG